MSHHYLHSICHYSTSIWLSLARINYIIVISIHLSTQIHSDCFYHAGISLILTLLSCSTSIEPWDKSMLTPTTTNCSTWASTYRFAPPSSYYLQLEPTTRVQYPGCCQVLRLAQVGSNVDSKASRRTKEFSERSDTKGLHCLGGSWSFWEKGLACISSKSSLGNTR